MIRLKPARKIRISNRLALVGALMLALTLFSGANDSRQSEFQLQTSTIAKASSHEEPPGPDERRKRFSISRLLFGHG